MTAPQLFEVRMLDMPLELRERSRQHGADLLREMTLIRTGEQGGSTRHEVPARLLELADALDTVYGPYIAASTQEMDDALDRGEQACPEIVYQLPAEAAGFVQRVADLLDEVERYCRTDDLLTLAPPPDIAAYRRWSIAEVVRQHAGQAPVPWPDYARQHGLGS